MKAVMVMFDTLNRRYLPPYGADDRIHAPNFARLAERTATFENCYAGSMPCMPARRELHTGRYNFLHRGWGPLEPFDDSCPQMLGDAGVYTHLVTDHQHYWEDGGATYHNRFRTYEFFRGQEGDAWKGRVADPEIPDSLRGMRGEKWRQDWINRGYLTREEDQPQTKTFDAGLEFIATNRAEDNWFVQIETFDPHEPFFSQDHYKALYKHDYDGPQYDWPDYRMVLETPEQVEHVRLEYAALLSMCAVGTIRIPPTLVDLAGGQIPGHMRGGSLARAGFADDPGLAFGMRNRMDARYDMVRTVRDSRFRYIRNYHPHRAYGEHQAYAWLAAGYRSWETEHLAGRLDDVQSAFWRAKPGVELYDTAADPDQTRNLAGLPEYADVERRLAEALREHMLAVRDNGFLPEGSPAEGYEASRAGDAYPLERVLDVADAVPRRDPDDLPLLVAALTDPDATVRRRGAIGLLVLGPAADDAAPFVRVRLAEETDPFVRIPCAEALALRGDEDAVKVLAEYAGPDHPSPVRLEALNALNALGPDAVRPFRDVVAGAAESGPGYIGNAGRHLLLRVDGTYTPESRVFDLDELMRQYRAFAARNGA